MQKISIVIPYHYKDQNYLEVLLKSLVRQVFDLSQSEIIISAFVPDRSQQRILKKMLNKYQGYFFIRLLLNKKANISYQLNQAIKIAHRKYLIRLDAHAELDKNYLKIVLQNLESRKYACVGGKRIARGKNFWQKEIAFCYNRGWFNLNSYFLKKQLINNVYFGAWERRYFIKEKLWFNPNLMAAEDYEQCWRLRQLGGKILYNPKIIFYYYPRDNLKDLAKQYFNYGKNKACLFKQYPNILNWHEFMVPIMVFFFPISWLFYLILNLIFSIYYRKFKFLPISLVFTIMHWGLGLGFWYGIFFNY